MTRLSDLKPRTVQPLGPWPEPEIGRPRKFDSERERQDRWAQGKGYPNFVSYCAAKNRERRAKLREGK